MLREMKKSKGSRVKREDYLLEKEGWPRRRQGCMCCGSEYWLCWWLSRQPPMVAYSSLGHSAQHFLLPSVTCLTVIDCLLRPPVLWSLGEIVLCCSLCIRSGSWERATVLLHMLPVFNVLVFFPFSLQRAWLLSPVSVAWNESHSLTSLRGRNVIFIYLSVCLIPQINSTVHNWLFLLMLTRKQIF